MYSLGLSLSNNGLVFGQLVKEGYVHIEVIDTGYLKDYYFPFNLVQENNIRGGRDVAEQIISAVKPIWHYTEVFVH